MLLLLLCQHVDLFPAFYYERFKHTEMLKWSYCKNLCTHHLDSTINIYIDFEYLSGQAHHSSSQHKLIVLGMTSKFFAIVYLSLTWFLAPIWSHFLSSITGIQEHCHFPHSLSSSCRAQALCFCSSPRASPKHLLHLLIPSSTFLLRDPSLGLPSEICLLPPVTLYPNTILGCIYSTYHSLKFPHLFLCSFPFYLISLKYELYEQGSCLFYSHPNLNGFSTT